MRLITSELVTKESSQCSLMAGAMQMASVFPHQRELQKERVKFQHAVKFDLLKGCFSLILTLLHNLCCPRCLRSLSSHSQSPEKRNTMITCQISFHFQTFHSAFLYEVVVLNCSLAVQFIQSSEIDNGVYPPNYRQGCHLCFTATVQGVEVGNNSSTNCSWQASNPCKLPDHLL